MKNKNGNKFLWGNYNYSNELSETIIQNMTKADSEQEKIDKNILSPIKTKIKEGIDKIKTPELINQLKDKLTSKNQNQINDNKYSYNINNEENIYEDVEDFQIKCTIDEYVDRVIGKDHILFYKIELSSSISGKNWEIYRSLQEFKDLYLIV